MDTAKSVDCVPSLLSDMKRPSFSSEKFCASRKVKLGQSRGEVLYFVQCEVKCATNVRRHFTAQQLHDAKHHFACRKARFVRKSPFVRGQKGFFVAEDEGFDGRFALEGES